MQEQARDKYWRYLQTNYSDSTASQYFNYFQEFYKFFHTQEKFDSFLIKRKNKITGKVNPFYIGFAKSVIECFDISLQIPKFKGKVAKGIREHKFLTKQQVALILDKTSNRTSLIVRLFFETGLRLRELLNCTRKQINIEERTITGIGKNKKPFIVKFSPGVANRFRVYLHYNPQEHPFWEKKAEPRDEAKSFQYFLKKECAELGIENVHPHRLRHALGHYLRVVKGFDLEQIRVKLRHSQLETTSIYTTATQKEVDDKMDDEVFK